MVASPAVGGHLKAVFEEGQSPACQRDLPQRDILIFQMSIPGKGHEDVRYQEKNDGAHRWLSNSQVGGRFQRRAAYPADHGRAVPTDQGIRDFAGAAGAVKRLRRRWSGIFLFAHVWRESTFKGSIEEQRGENGNQRGKTRTHSKRG